VSKGSVKTPAKLPLQQVVVIGGGTGSYVVISGLIKYLPQISALVTVADSGGSTGRLRDEFGFLPVGDLRQALAALAQEKDQAIIRDVLLYRFAKGSGLEGHNLGNLILTALQDLTGSTSKAVELASKIFRLHGHIYPITTQNVDLVIEYTDGTFIVGEHHLNPNQGGGKKIKQVRLSPRAKIYQKAKESIESAQVIIIGPGDLYASLLPNLVVSGCKAAFAKTKAKIIYNVNLMTSFTQTHQMTARDHVDEIERHIGRPVDYVIVNNAPIPEKIIQAYQKQQEYPVIDDLDNSEATRIIRAPLIKTTQMKQTAKDEIVRSFLRHEPQALAQIIVKKVLS